MLSLWFSDSAQRYVVLSSFFTKKPHLALPLSGALGAGPTLVSCDGDELMNAPRDYFGFLPQFQRRNCQNELCTHFLNRNDALRRILGILCCIVAQTTSWSVEPEMQNERFFGHRDTFHIKHEISPFPSWQGIILPKLSVLRGIFEENGSNTCLFVKPARLPKIVNFAPFV